MKVGKKIKELRKSLNMTQNDVAEELNISQAVYSRFESDKREPGLEEISQLSKIFNVNINYFFHEGYSLFDDKNINLLIQYYLTKKIYLDYKDKYTEYSNSSDVNLRSLADDYKNHSEDILDRLDKMYGKVFEIIDIDIINKNRNVMK